MKRLLFNSKHTHKKCSESMWDRAGCTFGTLHYDPKKAYVMFAWRIARAFDTPDERWFERKAGCVIPRPCLNLYITFFFFWATLYLRCVYGMGSSCIRLLQAPIQFAITCVHMHVQLIRMCEKFLNLFAGSSSLILSSLGFALYFSSNRISFAIFAIIAYATNRPIMCVCCSLCSKHVGT